jgi:hypothetical protein
VGERICLSALIGTPTRRWLAAAGCTLSLVAVATLPVTSATGTPSVTYGAMVVDNANQHVFVSVPSANQIDEFDFQGQLLSSVANVYGAWGMTISGQNLYVAESTAGAIVRINLDASPLSAQPVARGLNEPSTLTMAGGKLWTALAGDAGQWEDSVVSVDPSSGTVTTLPVAIDYPQVSAAAGDPNTLYVDEEGQSPGEILAFNAAASPATQLLDVRENDSNIRDMAISADGSRVIPAAGAPYEFHEFQSTDLQPDGLIYPGQAYPSAVAVSSSGLVAGGLMGADSPDVMVYRLGAPAATFRATTGGDVLPAGLALSADGSKLFAVAATFTGLQFDTFSLNSSSAPASDPIPSATSTSSTTSQSTTSSSTSQSPPVAPAAAPATSTPIPAGSAPATVPPTTSTPITMPAAVTETEMRASLARIKVTHRSSRRASPDASMSFSALRAPVISQRTHRLAGYRYFLDVSNIRCLHQANVVSFSVAGVRRTVACTSGTFVISNGVAVNRNYRVQVTALDSHARRSHRDGPTRSVRLRIPRGARWTQISVPPSGT